MSDGRLTDEALAQAELHRRLEEAVGVEIANRSGGIAVAPEAKPLPETRPWRPPQELNDTSDVRRLLVRLLLFFVALAVIYVAVQQTTYLLFTPRLEVLHVEVPSGKVAADRPVRVSALVTNRSMAAAAAFAVLVLATGEEIEGPTVAVGPGNTARVSVDVRPGQGVFVFSMVVFSSWRGVRRLASYPGLLLDATVREIDIDNVLVPAYIRAAEGAWVQFTGINRGHAVETVVPVVMLHGDDGALLEVAGDATAAAPGERINFRVRLEEHHLRAPASRLEVYILTAGGDVLGHGQFPFPFAVR
jgi:hypothetical protein